MHNDLLEVSWKTAPHPYRWYKQNKHISIIKIPVNEQNHLSSITISFLGCILLNLANSLHISPSSCIEVSDLSHNTVLALRNTQSGLPQSSKEVAVTCRQILQRLTLARCYQHLCKQSLSPKSSGIKLSQVSTAAISLWLQAQSHSKHKMLL